MKLNLRAKIQNICIIQSRFRIASVWFPVFQSFLFKRGLFLNFHGGKYRLRNFRQNLYTSYSSFGKNGGFLTGKKLEPKMFYVLNNLFSFRRIEPRRKWEVFSLTVYSSRKKKTMLKDSGMQPEI